MPPRAIFLDMDDTILDSSGGVEESWGLVCREFAGVLYCEVDPLRVAIRKAAQEFWKDEAIAGHWRVKLEESRVMYIENALREQGLDVSQARGLADRYDAEVTARYRLFDDAIETLEWLTHQRTPRITAYWTHCPAAWSETPWRRAFASTITRAEPPA